MRLDDLTGTGPCRFEMIGLPVRSYGNSDRWG